MTSNKNIGTTIMMSRLENQIKKTNADFDKLLIEKPRGVIKKLALNIKKRKRLENKLTAEKDKDLKTIRNLFDENKQLKRELSELRHQKKEINHNLREQIRTHQYKNREYKKELKEQKKIIGLKIKEHPIFIKNNEKARYQKLFTTVQFEIKPFETAYDGTVGNFFCRKKVGKNKDFIIPCKSGTQIEVILDKTIESRYQFYSDLLKRERGLKVNEKIKCVFKKYMV